MCVARLKERCSSKHGCAHLAQRRRWRSERRPKQPWMFKKRISISTCHCTLPLRRRIWTAASVRLLMKWDCFGYRMKDTKVSALNGSKSLDQQDAVIPFYDQMNFHFLTPIWGTDFTDRYLRFFLPAQIENLRAFADCVYKIIATPEAEEQIRQSPVFERLRATINVQFLP